MTDARVVSVNMHRLGESSVEKVNDVRRRATGDGEAVAPGESLEFLRIFVGGNRKPESKDRINCYI